MSKSHYTEGDILLGAKRKQKEARHPIIFISEHDRMFFLGAMITHSDNHGNIPLTDKHFEIKGKLDDKPQFLVQQLLLKKQEWGPFKKIGRLNSVGVKFVLDHVKKTEPTYWEDYLLAGK